ncbi:GSCFA domain-containing protein [soil metagenome]
MDFRTELLLKHSGNINLGDGIFTIGSCFAESIGKRFLENKFPSLVNPFGTIYHPCSIHKLLQFAIKKEGPDEVSFLINNETHLNFDFHSSICGNSLADIRNKINELVTEAHSFLKDCNVLILTYGTSWIYERTYNGQAVANCQKKPSSQFKKRLTSSLEIVNSFDTTHKLLSALNPDLKIIVTISPVRHLKDSIELNSVSKATLRVACHELSEKYSNVEYFPAFEIMMDDLRDYRFYKTDMIHPTETAEDYIWGKFSDRYFSQSTVDILSQWKEIRKAIRHRPFQPDSVSHQKFLQETLKKLQQLKSSIDVESEIHEIKSRMS